MKKKAGLSVQEHGDCSFPPNKDRDRLQVY